MTCEPEEYSGLFEEQHPWQNWLGDLRQVLEGYWEPDGLHDLVHIVAKASRLGKRVRPLGSGWSFEDLILSEDWVVNLDRLRRPLDVLEDATHPSLGIEEARRLVHFEAGIKIYELNEALANLERPLALPTMGGSGGQALAGAINTSTHGGDIEQGPFPDLVRAVHLVAATGQEYWIESERAPVADEAKLTPKLCSDLIFIRDDELFDAVRVAVGRFGVVYSYVLEATPAFRLAEFTDERPGRAVRAALRAGVASFATGGPLLDGFVGTLGALPPALGVATGRFPRFLQIVFNSSDMSGTCWTTRRWTTTATQDLVPVVPPSFLCQEGEAHRLINLATGVLRGTSALSPAIHAIPVVGGLLGLIVDSQMPRLLAEADRLDALQAQGGLTAGKALAEVINSVDLFPELRFVLPLVGEIAISGQFSESMKTGRVGRSDLIMAGQAPSAAEFNCFRADSVEVVFPATTTAYLDFLDLVERWGEHFLQSGAVALRYSASSRALLSMHNVSGPVAVSIEIASLANVENTTRWISFVESAARGIGGRPHWGQRNKLGQIDTQLLYDDRLERWRRQLRRIQGRDRTFSNDFTARRGLEPVGSVRTVKMVRRDDDGEIIGLANPLAEWAFVTAEQAVADIAAHRFQYFAGEEADHTRIYVVNGPRRRYLRTNPDDSRANNLDEMPSF